MSCFYRYRVFWNDECDSYKSRESTGIVVGESFTNAMENLSRYFGEDAIYRIEAEIITASPVIEDEELLDAIADTGIGAGPFLEAASKELERLD